MIKIKHIIQSAIDVLGMLTCQDFSEGESYIHKRTVIENSVAVILGLTGQLSGQVIIRLTEDNAKKIASIMMGMAIDELDDMSLSALSELGNMILGGASTSLAVDGITTDITPPAILLGSVQIKQDYAETVSVPLVSNELRVVLDITIKQEV